MQRSVSSTASTSGGHRTVFAASLGPARPLAAAVQEGFRVRDDASKAEVKQAVELMFEVKVEGVNLLNKPGKTRRFKNVAGKRNGFKKAYVRLETGQSIDFTGASK